jgi:phosphatidylglycerophosphate synthase
MIGTSWLHRLARLLVRPLVGSGVKPNHLTTLRLATGLLACAALIPGDAAWTWWAGWLWLASQLLDRADGELARIGNMSTPGGHRYDYIVDNIVNPAFFVALGLGLRDSGLGVVAVALGLWAGLALYACGYWSEAIERLEPAGTKAYAGAYGFDPDDALLLLAPIVWLGWSAHLLVAASLGVTVMMLLTGWRLWRLTGRRASAGAAR